MSEPMHCSITDGPQYGDDWTDERYQDTDEGGDDYDRDIYNREITDECLEIIADIARLPMCKLQAD